MYFVISGTVGVGYHLYQQPLDKERFKITHSMGQNSFFGDYYIMFNTTAEFIYQVIKEVEAFSLSKKFLMRKVFPKFPHIVKGMKEDSKYRYNSYIKEEIMKHKLSHIEVVNKRSTYDNIALRGKVTADTFVTLSQDGALTNDIGRTFAERVAGLVAETLKIDNSLNEFLGTVTSDFNSLVNQIDQMRGNLQMLKEETQRTTSELNRLKIEENAKKQPQFQASNV